MLLVCLRKPIMPTFKDKAQTPKQGTSLTPAYFLAHPFTPPTSPGLHPVHGVCRGPGPATFVSLHCICYSCNLTYHFIYLVLETTIPHTSNPKLNVTSSVKSYLTSSSAHSIHFAVKIFSYFLVSLIWEGPLCGWSRDNSTCGDLFQESKALPNQLC